MDGVIKISVFAVAGVLIALLLKSEKPAYGFLFGVALGILVLTTCFSGLQHMVTRLSHLQAYLGEGKEAFTILLRVLGITYVCDFSAGICRDAGYGFLATQLEILGKLTVTFSGISILVAVIDQISALW